jgi:hypothetical protein
VLPATDASFVVVPHDTELGPLRGQGASRAESADAVAVRVDDEATPSVRGMDTFLVSTGATPGVTPVVVSVGAAQLTLDVVVHDLADVDSIALETWEEQLRVAPLVTAAGEPVLSPSIAWTWDDGASSAFGSWLQLGEGAPTEVEACVFGTSVCVTATVPGVPRFAGDGVLVDCEGGCSHGGPASVGAWSALAGALAWAARRRAAR